MPFRSTMRVRFYELDPYNHVNHAAYIQYFEVGRIDLLEAVGWGLNRLHGLGYHLVVTGLETRFLASARAHDEVVVETEVGEIRRASSTWRQRILRSDEVIAKQVVTAAVTDLDGRPTRFPEGLAEALAPYHSA
ncbi:MAG TPA: thioesterase family protein [Acidimicrobiia bacterium]